MPVCLECGHEATRRRRNFFQKITDRAVYQCDHCRKRIHIRRNFFSAFGPFAECPGCGTRQLSRLKSRDYVDAISHNPLRHLLLLVGAPLYHCTFCRFQFRDWRKRSSLQ